MITLYPKYTVSFTLLHFKYHTVTQYIHKNNEALDIPVISGRLEETERNTGSDEHPFGEAADLGRDDPDIDLMVPKETLKLIMGLTNDGPDKKASKLPGDTSNSNIRSAYRNPDRPFHVRDEIDLEPVLPLPGRKSFIKDLPFPGHSKTRTKRIQLSKSRSHVEWSRADEGPDYGLSDHDSGQPDVPNIGTQESNEERTQEICAKVDHPTFEAKDGDPGSIDISSLSLDVDSEEITVLYEIFQGKRK